MRRNFHNSQRQDASALNLGNEWNEGWVTRVFETIWQSYNKLMHSYKEKGENAKDKIENLISSDLVRYANDIKHDVLKGYSSTIIRKLQFHNQPPDERKSNDIGVFMGVEDKPKFIFEAKKINTLTEKGIGSYIEDLKSYLSEYYGSHLSESALIAYLHTGTVNEIFELIEKVKKTTLTQFSAFNNRPHKTSKHSKIVANAKNPDFLCHHLIFEMQ